MAKAVTNKIKMAIKVSDEKRFFAVNVRDENGKIIGAIKNGDKVDVIDYNGSIERNKTKGKDIKTKKLVTGTILTRCLTPIE